MLGRAYIIFEADGQVFEMMGHIDSGTIDVEYPEPRWGDDLRFLARDPSLTRVELETKIVGNGYRIYRGASPFQQNELEATLPEVTDG